MFLKDLLEVTIFAEPVCEDDVKIVVYDWSKDTQKYKKQDTYNLAADRVWIDEHASELWVAGISFSEIITSDDNPAVATYIEVERDVSKAA